MKPFFTVIIPTLNEQEYLPKLLRSLARQTYRLFEVVIVDGMSKDQTVAKANRYASRLPALTVATSDKQHVSHQRNMGAAQAQGKFLVFLDADVTVPPEYLSKVYKTIAKKRVSLLTTWYKSDTDEPMDEFISALGNTMMDIANFMDKPFAGGWNTIIRRDVFIKLGGYDGRLKFAEDHDLVLRAAGAGYKLWIIRDVKVNFCMRRFRHYGYFKTLRTYATTSLHALMNKGVIEELFDYPMGGHTYTELGRKLPRKTRSTFRFFHTKSLPDMPA